ncbi:MAG TPA: FAD/NAD(P)-binding protein [Steroidobacteraceae bacterium]
MNQLDRSLGMSEQISRRDFINGVAVAAGSLALPFSSWAQASDDAGYPPARMGMRGSHPGSFEAAHAFRDSHRIDTASAAATGEAYDLIVVGAGLSGLSAAHFFLKKLGQKGRVLVLDNHDDFGGHAKRNELNYQGRTLVLNGGTLEIESPERYNAWALEALKDIGVDLDRYTRANAANETLYSSLGLRGGYFFDKPTFNSDRLVLAPEAASQRGHPFTEEFLRKAPISRQAQKDLLRLFDPKQPDYMPGLTSAEKKDRLARMSYRDYLLQVAKVDQQAYWFFSGMGRGVFSVGADALPALFAWQMMGGKGGGFDGLNLQPSADGLLADLPGGQHGRQKEGNGSIHFPDGNATLARLLVRKLVPGSIPGSTQEDIGAAHVDYSKLDRAENDVRIRLLSTVLNVRHAGDARSAKEVIVNYSTGGKLYEVRGKACVLACWNMMIPYIAPELPQGQREALAYNVKAPIVYTNVFLRNWRAFAKLGLSEVECPSMYHHSIALAEPCDLGALGHSNSPDEPIALRMIRTPGAPGLPRKEQHRIGRAELLATSFETFERNIREQLARVLAGSGFDPVKDIVGIAVNRWPHGYSYTYNSLYDPIEWVFSESNDRPCVKARQPFGLISIANADAAASPHTDAAFLEAHRAVEEVLERRTYPFLTGV